MSAALHATVEAATPAPQTAPDHRLAGEARLAELPLVLIAWAVAGIALHVGIARFTYGVMLPGLRRDLVLDYVASGALNSAHLAGFLIGTLLAPRIGAALGMVRLSRLSHLLVAAGALACAAVPLGDGWTGVAVMAAGRLATGLGAGGAMVAILVLVFAAVPAAMRAGVSAVVFAGMGVAVVASGLAAPWLIETTIGWRASFLAAGLLAVCLAAGFPPRAHAAVPAAEPAQPGATSGFRTRDVLASGMRRLVAAYFLFGVAYIAYSTFAGARLAAGQASQTMVATTWIAFGVAIVAGALLMIPVLSAPRLRHLALPGALAAGAIGAWIAAGEGNTAALAGALMVGLGVAATPALTTAQVRARVRAEDYATAHSGASAALGIGQFVGPVAAGALADWAGTAAVPIMASVVYAAAAMLAILDHRATRRPAPQEQEARG